MRIRQLKYLLKEFDDDKLVNVYLKLSHNFGVVSDIEEWGDDNGNLVLKISEDIESLNSQIKLLKNQGYDP